MKHVLSALVAIVLIVGLTLGSFLSVKPQEAQAATLIDCQLVVGQQTRVVCTLAGETLLNTVVDLPTVTLPPLPAVTVTAPGATVTLPPVTLPAPPRATETVRVNVPVPGPTATVTVDVPTNGSTATVTLPPEPRATKTVTESVRNGTSSVKPTATATATETVTEEVQVTGQPDPDRGTVEADTDDGGFFSPEIDFGDDTVTAGEAGVGLLGALLIIALILAGMYYGFRRGITVAGREEAYSLRSMLDRSKTS